MSYHTYFILTLVLLLRVLYIPKSSRHLDQPPKQRGRVKTANFFSSEYTQIFWSIYYLKIYFTVYAITFVPIFPLCPPPPTTPLPSSIPPPSSCWWVVHVSSLASPFPILFLTSLCLFCTHQLRFPFQVTSPTSPMGPSSCCPGGESQSGWGCLRFKSM